MERLIASVMQAIQQAGLVQVEVSARHVHLSRKDLAALFGADAQLTEKRPLSQPGQFLAEERVTLISPKAQMERTAILGPVRGNTQVELSVTDCFALGIQAPLRESGDIEGSTELEIVGPNGRIRIPQGVIVARNHIHITPDIAQSLHLADKQRVRVRVLSDRPVVFSDVLIRVSVKARFRMHVDVDEGNAAGITGLTLGQILRG